MKLWIPIALLVLASPRLALAIPEFPEELQKKANMPCAPQCTICHRDNAGGTGTTLTGPTGSPTFVELMYENGLDPDDPSSVGPAFDALEAAGADTDKDGVTDAAELRAGQNPNIKGDATLCGPTYGCGATVAKSERTDWLAVSVALFASAGLVASWRRRFQRRAAKSRRRS